MCLTKPIGGDYRLVKRYVWYIKNCCLLNRCGKYYTLGSLVKLHLLEQYLVNSYYINLGQKLLNK